MSTQTEPGSNGVVELLDTVSSRLASDGFSVQRGVRTEPYLLDIFASRVITGYTARGASAPWSNVVAVTSSVVPSPESTLGFSSFVAKYALENRKLLGLRRNDLTTIAVCISSAIGEETKKWLSETAPEYGIMWDRAEFPVLVDLISRTIIYYAKTPFHHMRLYPQLRAYSDKWFGLQTQKTEPVP